MTAPTINPPTTSLSSEPTNGTSSAGADSAATTSSSETNPLSSLPPTSRTGHSETEIHTIGAGAGTDFPADQTIIGTHRGVVGGDQATGASGQNGSDPQPSPAAAPVHTSTTPASAAATPKAAPPGVVDPQAGGGEHGHIVYDPQHAPAVLADPTLFILAAVVDDLENTRKANANRLGHLTRGEADSDGTLRGIGLDDDHPAVAQTKAIVEGIADVEKQAVRNLEKAMRKHPLGPWAKQQKGVGDKQIARLLAAVGDPYWNDAHNRPRTVSELWQYCGHGDPARSRKKKGQRVQHSPEAKMRVWNIAASLLKAGIRNGEGVTPWGRLYVQRKAATEGRLHADVCVRCGPAGKPAQPGSAWSDGHRHADAIRVLGKALLRDLWLEAKRIHELDDGSGQSGTDAQRTGVGVVVDTTTGEVLAS